MSMTDPIADMLTRIRNAQKTGDKQISMPSSKLKLAMLQILANEGYIDSVESAKTDDKLDLLVTLKYYQGRPVIEKIARVSRPGLRIYRKALNLPIIKSGLGIAIISTAKGVMTSRDASAQNLGGEVLCTVE